MFLQEKNKTRILTFLFLISVVIWIFVFIETKESNTLKVDFFDIGQGDSIFIETGDKKQILLDGGPDLTILEKLGRKMPFYDRYIDLIILSHPEADHLNGLIEVIKRYKVGGIIANGVIRNTEQYREWIEIIEEKNIPVYIAQSGGEIDFGNNIKLQILYPFESLLGKKFSDSNNTSIVTQLIYKNFETLFTGDIEKSVENKLINSGINLNSDILKVAHHGSKTSSSEEFLKAVNSMVNIIQAGKDNKYGHPHQEVLARMANAMIFVTAKNDIEILSDGEEFLVKK
jgi:competence protein ComEC